jgi:RNA polymerase primary sigma factor
MALRHACLKIPLRGGEMAQSVQKQDRNRKNRRKVTSKAVPPRDSIEVPAAASSEPDALSIYFKEIGGYPLLSKAEEARLSEIILKGRKTVDDILSEEGIEPERLRTVRDQIKKERLSVRESARLVQASLGLSGKAYRGLIEKLARIEGRIEAAKNQLVLSNLRLVVKIARNFAGSPDSLQDLIQEGNLALMQAAERYDHTLGYRFSTYAVWWIQKYIFSAINQQFRTIRIPDHVVKILSHVQKASQRLMQKNGRLPSYEEIAHASALDLAQVLQAVAGNREPLSIDAPMNEEEKKVLEYYLRDTGQPPPGHFLELAALRKHLGKTMSEALSPREETVIRMRYGINGDDIFFKPAAIGEQIGLSERRIRQIEKKALQKLKHPASSNNLRAFLCRSRN